MANITLQPEDLENLLGNLWDATYFVDRSRKIIYWSKTAENISGYSSDEVKGLPCGQNLLAHHCDTQVLCDVACPMKLTLLDGEVREAQVSLRHKNGESIPVVLRIMPFHDSEGKVIGAIEVFRKVPGTDEMAKMLERMGNLANIDPLTQAARRHYGEEILEKGLAAFATAASPVGILMIDLDDFKSINDNYGHAAGDKVLKDVSKYIRDHLRASDLLVRWGGDEFLVVTSGNSVSGLQHMGEKICELFAATHIEYDKQRMPVGISVGGAVVTNGDTVESLVKRADDMLYQGKQQGKNRCLVAGLP